MPFCMEHLFYGYANFQMMIFDNELTLQSNIFHRSYTLDKCIQIEQDNHLIVLTERYAMDSSFCL